MLRNSHYTAQTEEGRGVRYLDYLLRSSFGLGNRNTCSCSVTHFSLIGDTRYGSRYPFIVLCPTGLAQPLSEYYTKDQPLLQAGLVHQLEVRWARQEQQIISLRLVSMSAMDALLAVYAHSLSGPCTGEPLFYPPKLKFLMILVVQKVCRILQALAPLVFGRTALEAFSVGATWGLGHSLTVVALLLGSTNIKVQGQSWAWQTISVAISSWDICFQSVWRWHTFATTVQDYLQPKTLKDSVLISMANSSILVMNGVLGIHHGWAKALYSEMEQLKPNDGSIGQVSALNVGPWWWVSLYTKTSEYSISN